MQKLLSNAFSLNMVRDFPLTVSIEKVDLARAAELASEHQSVVGHADTAAVFADQLGAPVAFNRQSVSLEKGDRLLVGQYTGPRLPEGCKTLPDGARIEWLLVTLA